MYIYLKLNKIVIIIIIILKKRNSLYGSEQAVTLKFFHALKDLSDFEVLTTIALILLENNPCLRFRKEISCV